MSTIADAGDGLTRSTGEDGVLVLHALERARHDPFRSFIAVAESAPQLSHPRAAFAGVPFAAKDNLEARGFPTTANTPALLGTSGTAESPAVAALRAVGAVLIGKTGMHELALGVTSSAAASPRDRESAGFASERRWLIGGLGCSSGRGDRPLRARHRHGGIDHHSSRVVRSLRLPPIDGPLVSSGDCAALEHARYGRRDRRIRAVDRRGGSRGRPPIPGAPKRASTEALSVAHRDSR